MVLFIHFSFHRQPGTKRFDGRRYRNAYGIPRECVRRMMTMEKSKPKRGVFDLASNVRTVQGFHHSEPQSNTNLSSPSMEKTHKKMCMLCDRCRTKWHILSTNSPNRRSFSHGFIYRLLIRWQVLSASHVLASPPFAAQIVSMQFHLQLQRMNVFVSQINSFSVIPGGQCELFDESNVTVKVTQLLKVAKANVFRLFQIV